MRMLPPPLTPQCFTLCFAGPDALTSNDLRANITMQPETEAVMNWTHSLPFVVSVTLQAGKEVVSYPYNRVPPTGKKLH